MDLRTVSGELHALKDEALVILFGNGVDKKLDERFGGYLSQLQRDWQGEFGETRVLPTFKKLAVEYLILVHLGKKELTPSRLKQAAAAGARAAREVATSITLAFSGSALSKKDHSAAITEGALLGLYVFDKYKTKKSKKHVKSLAIHDGIKEGVEYAEKLAKAVYVVRDLVNEPACAVTPLELAAQAKHLAKQFKLKLTVWDKKQIQKAGMNALLAVNSGSAVEPRFIVLEYGSKGKPICLVGKGITFDSGGLDLKPSKAMVDMKIDMAGAAAVLGTLMAAASLKLPVHLVGIIASTENMPGGAAYKPGDVIKTYSGKTIEIANTDAEGRVVLADALAYAAKLDPKYIIDLATLTGACIIALGDEASGLIGNDPELIAALEDAGEKADDRVWHLPLWDSHRDQVKGVLADVKNLGHPQGYGGAITAAAFLEHFVGEHKWAHLDIAGPAHIEDDRMVHPKGATGAGVRLLVKFLESN